MDRTITGRCSAHAANRPDQVAIVCEGRETSYEQLHRASNRTAHALLAAGLDRGARVAYLGRESEYYLELALGCAKSGTVLVPANWRLTAPEVDHILRDSRAELLFVESEFMATVDRLGGDLPDLRRVVRMDSPDHLAGGFLAFLAGQPDSDPGVPAAEDDPVAQMYTSGTTGMPKGVVLPHRSFFTFIENMRRHGVDWIDWRPSDRSLSCFTSLHSGGYAWFMHCFNVGATSVVMRSFVPEEAVRLISAERVTTMWAAPAMLRMMLSERAATPEAFRSLRKIVYGGSPISQELLSRCIEGFGCDLAQAYAAAETGSFVTCLPAADHVPGSPKLTSAGRVCPGNEVRILSEAGHQVPTGNVGRICVWTPAHFLEYWEQPEETGKLLIDGWLHMADAGYLDEDGYLYIRDRINDTIIVAGQNIYPVEVENALAGHPAVADVAVVGAPDQRWGEIVKAVVVLHDGAQASGRELMRWLRGRIADFKIPTKYEFVDRLPRNPTGKVLRRVLQADAQVH